MYLSSLIRESWEMMEYVLTSFSDFFIPAATRADESKPPLNKNPTGTSLRNRILVLSSRSARNSSTVSVEFSDRAPPKSQYCRRESFPSRKEITRFVLGGSLVIPRKKVSGE